MINCPNCDKEIADDTVHCGYCGHQLEEKEKKKTMFGMAALDGEQLEEAVAKAKKAREDGDSSSSGGGLKIPRPDKKKSGSASSKGSGGLKIPKPGQKNPGLKTPEAEADAPQQDAPAMAKTERIDLSDAPHPSDELDAQASPQQAAAPGQDQEVPTPDAQPDLQAGGIDSVAATDVDDVAPGQSAETGPGQPPETGPGQPAGPEAGFGPPAGADAEPNMSGFDDGPAAADEPGADDAAAAQLGEPAGPGQAHTPLQQMDPDDGAPQGGPAAGAAPGAPAGPGGPQQQDGFGQQEIDTGAPPKEKKSKTGLIIALVIFVLIGGLGCLGGVAYFLINHTHLFS